MDIENSTRDDSGNERHLLMLLLLLVGPHRCCPVHSLPQLPVSDGSVPFYLLSFAMLHLLQLSVAFRLLGHFSLIFLGCKISFPRLSVFLWPFQGVLCPAQEVSGRIFIKHFSLLDSVFAVVFSLSVIFLTMRRHSGCRWMHPTVHAGCHWHATMIFCCGSLMVLWNVCISRKILCMCECLYVPNAYWKSISICIATPGTTFHHVSLNDCSVCSSSCA